MAAARKRLTRLPGASTIHVDLSTITCVRTDVGDAGAVVVVHTTEGYALAVTPTEEQSASQLVAEIIEML